MTKMYWAQLGSMSRLVAVRKGGVVSYLHHDHLGSTKTVTGGSQAFKYYPYGSTIQEPASTPTDNLYTGQKRDLSTGLYFYNARYYDSYLNRWIQPDSIVPQPGNPQALNRYSYGYNNPLRYTDPSGHDPEDWFDDQWKSEFSAAHNGANPKANDYAYRFLTMAWASGMIDKSLGIDPTFPIPDDPGADIEANMADSARNGQRYYNGGDPAAEFLADLGDFVASVLPDAKWDIKAHYGEEYQDYGNFHYGAMGAARGYSRGFLLRGAGVAQFMDDSVNNLKIIISMAMGSVATDYTRPGLPDVRGWRGPKAGVPGVVPPYSDDPRDQAMVNLGITFYHVYQKARPRSGW